MTEKIITNIKYRIEEFIPKQVPDEFWEKYFTFFEKLQKELNPYDPVPDRTQRVKDIKSSFPKHFEKRWLVYAENNKIIGSGIILFPEKDSPQFEANPHLIQASVDIDRDYRRQGIGTKLLQDIINVGISHKRMIIETEIESEEGKAFSVALGGTVALEEAENRLQYCDIDWNLMEQWRNEGKQKADGVVLEIFYYDVPDDIIEEYCTLVTQIENFEVPSGGLELKWNYTPEMRRQFEAHYKERGYEWISMVSREKDGTISGVTDIVYPTSEPYKIFQELTGVLPAYQKRGIGKWLKAEMAFYIKDKYSNIKYLTTGNANENAAMLSINERMGYKYYKSKYGVKLQLHEFVKKLKEI